MLKQDVKLGSVYAVKISGLLRPVRLDSESPYGGWNATNLGTSRVVRIRTAQKLRYELEPATEQATSGIKWRKKR
jgi:hypothetical protein